MSVKRNIINIGLLGLILFSSVSFAVTEVNLEKEPLNLKSFPNWLNNNSIIVNKGIVGRVDVDFYLDMYNEMTFEKNKEFSDTFNFPIVAPGVTVHFKDNKTRAGFLYSFIRKLDYNDFFEKISALYLEHDILPNQHIALGVRRRLPIGYEGSMSSVKIPFFIRSQIGRKLGNVYGFGLNNTASYKYVDYDIGVYDGSRFMNRLFNGSEFAGMIQFKPLANFDDKYGNLKIGTSVDTGNQDGSFSVVSVNTLYEYKKLYFDFEYSNANGFSRGKVNHDKYGGFYTTLGYKLTDKLNVLGRYDYLKNQTHGRVSKEYSAGLTYNIRQGLDILTNYVFVDSDFERASQHKIYFGTRFNLGEFSENL